mmetsp:Transcript_34984/g.78689  ORF Transcript_34984/g.78689 Transcript_34984/m.78689 type:complete len:1072 (-) Transcript_34984:27-3242(-)
MGANASEVAEGRAYSASDGSLRSSPPSSHSSDTDAEEVVAPATATAACKVPQRAGGHGSWGALAKDAALVARKRRILGEVDLSDSGPGEGEVADDDNNDESSDSASHKDEEDDEDDDDGEGRILGELDEIPNDSCNFGSIDAEPLKAGMSSPATATPTMLSEAGWSSAESSGLETGCLLRGLSSQSNAWSHTSSAACSGTAASEVIPAPLKGKGKGGSASEPLVPCKGTGKGPPVKGKGKGKAGSSVKLGNQMRRTNTDPVALPIGRKLSLRPGTLDATVFKKLSLLDSAPSTPHNLPEEDESCDAFAEIDRSLCLGSSVGVNPAQVDLSALRQAFAPSASSSTPKVRVNAKSAAVELLSRKVAQNLGILFLSSKVDTSLLASSIIRLDPEICPFNQEELQRLLSAWPSQEELAPLLQYRERGADLGALRDIERQLLPLLKINRMAQRCRCVMLLRFLGDRLTEALNRIATVRAACRELQSSSVLRNVLSIILVLFNYTNFGTEAAASPEVGQMRGIDVLSLLKLRDTKAYQGDFPGYNMLHFVVKQLLLQQPHLKSSVLIEEFRRLPRAGGFTLDSMHKELRQLQSDLSFVTGELHHHGAEYGVVAHRSSVARVDASCTGQGLFGSLLGTGMDLVGFADAWMRGTEVLGGLRKTHPAAPGFNLVLGDDGGAVPPGWLWLLRPSGRWLRCWCEVRHSVLVIYKVPAKRCTGALYIALPHAEVSAFDTLPAADLPQSLLASAPHGFEINNRAANQTVRMKAAHQKELNRWLCVLNRQTMQPGSGFLLIHHNGRPLLGGSMGWYYCCLHDSELHAFARPRHGVEGAEPNHVFPLTGRDVAALGADGVSAEARELTSDMRNGFELSGEDSEDAWQFVCESSVEEGDWLKAVAQAIATSEPDLTPDGALVVHTDLTPFLEQDFASSNLFESSGDVTIADDVSCGESDDDESKEGEGEETPRHQLETLEQSLTEAVELWSTSLAAAEDDCKGLLNHFGVKEPPQPQMLSEASSQLLQALAGFVGELRRAWEDIRKHEEGVLKKKKADARTLARQTQSRATSAHRPKSRVRQPQAAT